MHNNIGGGARKSESGKCFHASNSQRDARRVSPFPLSTSSRTYTHAPWQDNKIKGEERVVPSRHVALLFPGHRQHCTAQGFPSFPLRCIQCHRVDNSSAALKKSTLSFEGKFVSWLKQAFWDTPFASSVSIHSCENGGGILKGIADRLGGKVEEGEEEREGRKIESVTTFDGG